MRSVFLHSLRMNTILCMCVCVLFRFSSFSSWDVFVCRFFVCSRHDMAVCGIWWAPCSKLHTPYRIWLTVNNLHITHVNSEHSHSPIQWPLCACNEFLCIWIKCCSTHMITEKSHSATAIKAAKNWIYSHSSAVFFSLSSHHSQMEMYTLNGAVPVFATFFFCLFFFIIRVLNFAHRFYCWIIL